MVLIEIPPGELADRISILKIKAEYIRDPKKLECIINELEPLEENAAKEDVDRMYAVNKVLWDVENEIRLCEKNGDFGPNFVRLARLVYVTNDRRSEIKREISRDSAIAEQKQYTAYAPTKRQRMVVMTHMGLGDHLVCNGMIRHFAKKYDVVTYVKHQYVQSVRDMFRDLGPTVTVTPVDDDRDAWNKALYEQMVIRTGIFTGRQDWDSTKPWCDAFYVNANLSPKLLRDEFFMLRSRDREEFFYKRVVDHLGTDRYVVVHDDPSRYDAITIKTDLPVVRIGRGLFRSSRTRFLIIVRSSSAPKSTTATIVRSRGSSSCSSCVSNRGPS
jgi:hypothetical protein